MADALTPAQRSYCMSQVRGKDTSLERAMRYALRAVGLRFAKYASDLPGRPDIVFRKKRVVVFVDGDFWHGYRLPQWEKKLSPFWKKKIAGNRARDRRNFAKLRRRGWKVLRIWGHEIKRNPDGALLKIRRALRS